jgi:hypothetical protein
MDLTTTTKFYAQGTRSDILKLEKSLHISDDQIDFTKIIPLPYELEFQCGIKEINQEDLKDWTSKNWGTPFNGKIQRIQKTFGTDIMGYEIELITIYNEPTKIIDEIIRKNPKLDYFIHHYDFTDQEYLSFKSKDNVDIKIICEILRNEHTNNVKFKFDKSNIFNLKQTIEGHFHWKFLWGTNIGSKTIEKLQSINY